MKTWTLKEEPFPLDIKHAQLSVKHDMYADRRSLVFEPALQEIVKMLYQNIWTKFKIAETGKKDYYDFFPFYILLVVFMQVSTLHTLYLTD